MEQKGIFVTVFFLVVVLGFPIPHLPTRQKFVVKFLLGSGAFTSLRGGATRVSWESKLPLPKAAPPQ